MIVSDYFAELLPAALLMRAGIFTSRIEIRVSILLSQSPTRRSAN